MEKPRIIIADRSSKFLEKCTEILRDINFEAVPVADGLEAKVTLISARPIGVLAHVELPRMDGFSLCRYIKEEYDMTVPVILMTHNTEEDIYEQAIEAGAENVIYRPIKKTELIFCVRTIVKLRELLLDNQRLILGKDSQESTGMGGIFRSTGVFQYQFFKAFLSVEMKRAKRYGFPLSLMLVALDNPESIEVKYGAQLLRQLLVGLHKAIRKSIREIDLPVTLKDETMLILMPHTDLQGAQVVAERLRRRIKRSVYREGDIVIHPTISIGVTAYKPEEDVDFTPVIKRVSNALKEARSLGGNKVIVEF